MRSLLRAGSATQGQQVVGIRGADNDVFSAGHLCPRAVALKDLHEGPDRLRTPLIRRNGALQPATWDEAFAEIEAHLVPLQQAHGRDAVAIAVGTQDVFSAGTLDQMPKQLASGWMSGHWLSVAVPDIERTQYMLVIGANPMASNPVLSAPGGERLAKAHDSLDFMLSLDIDLNETTRHADVVRPGLSALQDSHDDIAFPQPSFRNHARYSARCSRSNGHGSMQAQVQVEISDSLMPGVLSLPHGWGHGLPGTQMRLAALRPGAKLNQLMDTDARNPLSGNAVLSGVAVTLAPA